MLFALYLADLGELQVDLGSKLGMLSYQDYFFVDDVVVMGQGEGDLKLLLRMVGEYGREWKMQLNLSKSS